MSERLSAWQPERNSLKSRLRNVTLSVVIASSPASIGMNPLIDGFPVSKQEYSEEIYERRIEEKFNINLLTTREYTNLTNYDRESIFNPRKKIEKVFDWTPERLDQLKRALPLLPEHFYRPGQEGGKLDLVLTPYSDTEGACACLPPGGDKSVDISRGVFESRGEDEPMSTLTHELTHRIQPWVSKVENPDHPYDFESPWVLERDKILGIADSMLYETEPNDAKYHKYLEFLRKVKELKPDVYDKWLVMDMSERDRLLKKMKETGSLTIEEEEVHFAYRFLYGIAAHPAGWRPSLFDSEFFAVMAETYIRGKDYFYNMYGDYLEPEQVEQFYEFTKKEIFADWEYLDHKPIPQTTQN